MVNDILMRLDCRRMDIGCDGFRLMLLVNCSFGIGRTGNHSGCSAASCLCWRYSNLHLLHHLPSPRRNSNLHLLQHLPSLCRRCLRWRRLRRPVATGSVGGQCWPWSGTLSRRDCGGPMPVGDCPPTAFADGEMRSVSSAASCIIA